MIRARRPDHGTHPPTRPSRAVTVHIEELPGGRWRAATVGAGAGFVFAATNPAQLVAGLNRAMTEQQIATHAAARGATYDTATVGAETRTGAPKWRTPHDIRDWTVDPDGMWRSPGGFRHKPGSPMVTRVVAKLTAQGLPIPTAGPTTAAPAGRVAGIGADNRAAS